MFKNLAILALFGLIDAREPLLSKEASPLLVHQKPAYKDWDVDYKVPNFGQDIDIKASLANTRSAEKKLHHVIDFMNHDLPVDEDGEHPQNYFVPNFGKDHDIIATQRNIASAENKLKYKMHADFKLKDGVPRNYFVPDFGVDEDIAASLKNSKKWNPSEKALESVPRSIEFKL